MLIFILSPFVLFGFRAGLYANEQRGCPSTRIIHITEVPVCVTFVKGLERPIGGHPGYDGEWARARDQLDCVRQWARLYRPPPGFIIEVICDTATEAWFTQCRQIEIFPMSENEFSNHRAGPQRLKESGMRLRILDATLEAITRLGIDRFSIADVSRLAKISRQSLYRHFKNKDDLLISLTRHLEHVVEADMELALKAASNLDEILEMIAVYEGGPKSNALLNAEPAHMLQFIRARPQHSRVKAILERALAPFLDEVERESGIPVDRDLITELIERIKVSMFLFPEGAGRDFSTRAILAIVHSVVTCPEHWRLPTRAARRRGSKRDA